MWILIQETFPAPGFRNRLSMEERFPRIKRYTLTLKVPDATTSIDRVKKTGIMGSEQKNRNRHGVLHLAIRSHLK